MTVRSALLLALLLGGSLAAADTPVPSSPFDPIARIARSRTGSGSFAATFDSKACSIRIVADELALSIPLRNVTWSMTTESNVIVVTARCPAKSSCMGGSSNPRYAFQLAAPARDARKRFTELKSFTRHCAK